MENKKKLPLNPMVRRTLDDLTEVIKDALALPNGVDATESRKKLKAKTKELISRVQDMGDTEMNNRIDEIIKTHREDGK